ncbi:unnamed protein product [Protopolystoma xenopodis]|uniref:RRM domain-containing protein n=1 Tax=Protopolystoma xenopodis TaxID=117903 RepID=A0A3S5ALL4_9PLAT|nr:unnamed protein product [Protopolystoma xenopodis]
MTTHEDLRRLFGRYGRIADVTIPLDYFSGRMKGYAFVEYPFRPDLMLPSFAAIFLLVGTMTQVPIQPPIFNSTRAPQFNQFNQFNSRPHQASLARTIQYNFFESIDYSNFNYLPRSDTGSGCSRVSVSTDWSTRSSVVGDQRDAEDAHEALDHTRFMGRDIEVEFTRGHRKTPAEMRGRDRYGDSRKGGNEFDHRGKSRSRSNDHHKRRDESRRRSCSIENGSRANSSCAPDRGKNRRAVEMGSVGKRRGNNSRSPEGRNGGFNKYGFGSSVGYNRRRSSRSLSGH